MFHRTKSSKIKQLFSGKILLVLILFSLLAFSLHKEYYSLTKIDYNQKEKAVQISMRLFTNDMELALSKQFEKALELGTKYEIADADKLFVFYLNQNFSISINGKQTPYQFLGKEFEKDAMFVYLEIKNIESIEQISVRNAILTKTFYEQENIVKLHINGRAKSLILTSTNDKGMLNF